VLNKSQHPSAFIHYVSEKMDARNMLAYNLDKL